ncbi:MAG: YhfC family glutamic-type intramembrane protease, partial [Eubacteriales bacterium]
MFSDASLVCIVITLFICLCAPAILALVMIFRRKASWKAFVLGIAVFTVFQLFTRIPLLGILQNTGWFVLFEQTNTVAYILALAFTAGLFEEGGRFIGMRFFMKKNLSWNNGIVFGLGHGGIEAFVLVGIPILMGVMQGDSSIAAAQPYLI